MLRLSAVISLMMFSSSLTHAALLVDWGGDYLTGTGTSVSNLNLPTPTDSSTTRTWAYNSSTTIVPASGYTTTATSANFYGSLQFTYASGPANFTTARIDNNNDVNRINISTPVNSGVAQTIAGFLTWQKADFLNGLSSQSVSLASGNLLSLNFASVGGAGTVTFRALIQQGGQWYLSANSFTNSATGTFTIDLYSTNWALWTPASDLSQLPSSYTLASSTFTDITSAGFYFSGSRSNSMSFQIDSVEFNAVPEPSIMAMALASVCVLLTIQRRRSSSSLR